MESGSRRPERISWPLVRGLPLSSLPGVATALMPAEMPWEKVLASAGLEGKRPSAVIMLFIPPLSQGGSARIVFTRRSTTVGSHKGQIGFPGGRQDSVDPSPETTATRELEEELGVSPAHVFVAGMLPAERALDRHPVFPVLALANLRVEDFVASQAEVAEVFAAPWHLFVTEKSRDFQFNIFGKWLTSRLFETPAQRVWGLTAKILHAAALA